MAIIRTAPHRDIRTGRPIKDPKKVARLMAHGLIQMVDHRQKCRICGGTHKAPTFFPSEKQKGAWVVVEGSATCEHCDEKGKPKNFCGDCGEPLPCCSCFSYGGYKYRQPMEVVDE